MIERQTLWSEFRQRYGRAPRLFRAPGRVNLIGEHTDYNGGFVLPMAIDLETVVAAAPRADQKVRVYSLNMNEGAEFDLENPGTPQRGMWLDYVEGVAHALLSSGMRVIGADLMISSDVLPGCGLSSSAALEVASGLALTGVAGEDVDPVQLALAGQQAEHTYVGTMCGIMDQLVSVLGRRGHALLIDCRTLEATPVPLDTKNIGVVVCNSMVRHELASSEYNVRRAECERGVELLQEALPGISKLRDVTSRDFEEHGGHLPEPIRRRCRHVVTENQRTLRAAASLRVGDLDEVGSLMNRSHESLRDDYEVSSAELDALVEIAQDCEGVLGSRMTGGGFGGSTVSLVHRTALEEVTRTISTAYEERTGITPKVFITEPGDGMQEVSRD
ncbi:MAG: galactokinase [Pyrinomonadaceae bacterium]|nr:galactokinase [Pyrinomonadaceae bacterium]